MEGGRERGVRAEGGRERTEAGERGEGGRKPKVHAGQMGRLPHPRPCSAWAPRLRLQLRALGLSQGKANDKRM